MLGCRILLIMSEGWKALTCWLLWSHRAEFDRKDAVCQDQQSPLNYEWWCISTLHMSGWSLAPLSVWSFSHLLWKWYRCCLLWASGCFLVGSWPQSHWICQCLNPLKSDVSEHLKSETETCQYRNNSKQFRKQLKCNYSYVTNVQ